MPDGQTDRQTDRVILCYQMSWKCKMVSKKSWKADILSVSFLSKQYNRSDEGLYILCSPTHPPPVSLEKTDRQTDRQTDRYIDR